ncbi:hypothetical protein HHJ45_21535 [Escherichia coli]|uniref:Uncharacterized protein n=1 Tax=Escherichia coli MS 85-1 TaxID=679202 RepID=A0AAN3SC67_ECOLX|nr:hypothetical protein [Escherichia coli]EFJ85463.1 hypothetical protein HMPREF9536_04241 [Escherichia coli MS 84-1]EFK68278.1 hypothetical protein HMPREF9347_02704 [Escherichia coli MS 124-1]EFU32527.1 hypothetical protein HMPREF9350_05659 [Escherichia coli MS 85-1]QJT87608.1 hypothetical protein HHJ45_21535 [Escherichia coli]
MQGKNTQQQRMDLKTTKSEGKRINKTPETQSERFLAMRITTTPKPAA